MIIGVGEPARQLATALRSHSDTLVVGFVDPDGQLNGMDIIGLRVYGVEDIPALIENYGIKQVVVSEPALEQKQRQDFARLLGRLPVSTRILPPIADLTAGKYLVSSLRNVEIDDLLGRSPVPPDAALLREVVEGRRIMVTGLAALSAASSAVPSPSGTLPASFCSSRVNLHFTILKGSSDS